MSNDALIQDLSRNLTPVKRRSMMRETLLLSALGLAELALILGLGAMRPDMGAMIGSAYMIWRLGSLAILAGISCAIAIRSFAPPVSPHRGLRIVACLAALAAIGGLFVDPMPDGGLSLLDRIAPVHGVLCALSIIVLSLPIMATLAVLMRRAAPVHAGASALASGLAAGTCGAVVFAFCCPMNDPLYVIIWYSVGTATVAAIARWLLPRRFRL